MKLAHYQFERHLQARTLAPIYIISSDDILLRQEACTALRQTAHALGFTEALRFFAESGFDWEQFYSTAYAISLFATRRIIDIDLMEANIQQAAGQLLKKYAEAPPNDTLLLLRMGKIDKKAVKTAWFLALEKSGVVLTLWPPAREALPQWLKERAAREKVALDSDAITLLAKSAEGNLFAAAQTLHKLSLLQTNTVIDRKILASLLTDEAQFTIFDFVDSLLAADKARSLRILEHLKQEGVEPTLQLWAITREYRMLTEFSQAMQQGTSFSALCAKHRVLEKRQALIQQCLRQQPLEKLYTVLQQAAQIDRTIKGAEPGEAWAAFAGLLY